MSTAYVPVIVKGIQRGAKLLGVLDIPQEVFSEGGICTSRIGQSP